MAIFNTLCNFKYLKASVEISISSQSEIVIKDFLAWILPN